MMAWIASAPGFLRRKFYFRKHVCVLHDQDPSGHPTTRSMRVPNEQPIITLEARRHRVNNAAKLRIHLRVVAWEIVAFGTDVEPERDHSAMRLGLSFVREQVRSSGCRC